MAEQDKRPRAYWEGFKDGAEKVWDEVQRMSTKGYTPRELQIMAKSRRYAMISEIERELGIEKPVEKARAMPDLSPGTCTLIREQKPEKGFALFSRLVSEGRDGYCIVRTPPDFVRSRYGIQGVGILWLSSSEVDTTPLPPSALGISVQDAEEEAMKPENLPLIYAKAENFMEGHRGSVLFIEGIEYLITNNGFQPVLRFVQRLRELTARTKSYLVLSLEPSTIEPKEYSLLEHEMSDVL
ncbi:MAG: DUF835 domain-containing protein [Candidatus Thermoplasmatota archaeon]